MHTRLSRGLNPRPGPCRHFRAVVAPLLDGQAKAMVVLGSRVEAVRWQLAMTQYIAEQVRAGIKRVLLGPGQLWEALRARASALGEAA